VDDPKVMLTQLGRRYSQAAGEAYSKQCDEDAAKLREMASKLYKLAEEASKLPLPAPVQR
jgi:hypothetical protein